MLEAIFPRILSRYQIKRAEAGLEPDELMTDLTDIAVEKGIIRGRCEAVDVVQDHYFGPEGEYGYNPGPESRLEAKIILLLNSIGAVYLTIAGKGGLSPAPNQQEA